MNIKGDKARDLCSDHVVRVEAEQRVAEVSVRIAARSATHCAVFDGRRGFIGLVRLNQAAARPVDRIFADLLLQPAPLDVHEETEASVVLNLMEARGSHELLVLSSSREYVGSITRQSALAWRMARR